MPDYKILVRWADLVRMGILGQDGTEYCLYRSPAGDLRTGKLIDYIYGLNLTLVDVPYII